MRIGDAQKLRNCALGAECPIKMLSFPNYGMIMNPTGQKVKGYLLSYKTRKPLNPKLQALSPNPTKTIGYRVTISNSTSAHGPTASETASGRQATRCFAMLRAEECAAPAALTQLQGPGFQTVFELGRQALPRP